MKILQRPSPWKSKRAGSKISLIVVHGTHGTDQGDLSYMTDPKHNAKVSYHNLITRDGTVYQLVDHAEKAWHAGKSEWKGQKNVNEFSIGIGLSNKEGEPYTEEQYRAAGELIARLMKEHGLQLDDVVGHFNVSYGRKTDPWETFWWGRLFAWITGYLVPQ